MCVRASRITVLKSAGNFTRYECRNLNAEKIQRVKCFMFTRCGILRASNFLTPARPAGFENFWLWWWQSCPAAGYALAARGVDTRTLQAFMGHRSTANTVVYTVVADKRIRNIWGK